MGDSLGWLKKKIFTADIKTFRVGVWALLQSTILISGCKGREAARIWSTEEEVD
jgi:hypothetical protein